jgi:hypothetical protein
MNSKRFLTILVAGMLVAMFVGVIMPGKVLAETSATTVVLQVNSTTAIVNGKNVTLDVAPYIDASSGRTLVPLRFISESLGYMVRWDDQEKAVRIYNKIDMDTIDRTDDLVEYFWSWSTYKYVKLTIGSNVAETCDQYIIGEYVHIENVSIEQAPVIKDGRTMLPVRFVSEQMGLNVEWDGKTQKITISSNGEGYVPELIETALKKVAVPYTRGDNSIEDVSGYMKSQQPEKYFMKIGNDGFGYYIDLAVQSSEYNGNILSGDIIGLKGDTACFGYTLANQEDYKYDGTIKVAEEGFVISYTNEKGEKCSITFPNK